MKGAARYAQLLSEKERTRNDGGRVETTWMSADRDTSQSRFVDARPSTNFVFSTAFGRHIPVLPRKLAILLCVVNVVLPGIGTIVSGFGAFSSPNHQHRPFLCMCVNIVVGIMQLLTLPLLLLGWIWSFQWGLALVETARKRETYKPDKRAIVNTEASVAQGSCADIPIPI